MTPKQYKAARIELGLYNVEMARLLGVHTRTAQRYESGDIDPIPDTVARLIEMYVRFGVPEGW